MLVGDGVLEARLAGKAGARCKGERAVGVERDGSNGVTRAVGEAHRMRGVDRRAVDLRHGQDVAARIKIVGDDGNSYGGAGRSQEVIIHGRRRRGRNGAGHERG